ncbi:hypothetical protein [Rhodovulum visakhapatnamense]|uniref:Uncharacterized protein n=1 Tax=Rhodovulum visakhapatnamense TaxID=364297 RepID=A0A4R8FEP4_9RHOB|nr:hypothetical protein [Rhodovulum visakhapatnamense]TDX22228.1 hypothetical protein EV657_13110 [Rhodovulum visakhapatnamense]
MSLFKVSPKGSLRYTLLTAPLDLNIPGTSLPSAPGPQQSTPPLEMSLQPTCADLSPMMTASLEKAPPLWEKRIFTSEDRASDASEELVQTDTAAAEVTSVASGSLPLTRIRKMLTPTELTSGTGDGTDDTGGSPAVGAPQDLGMIRVAGHLPSIMASLAARAAAAQTGGDETGQPPAEPESPAEEPDITEELSEVVHQIDPTLIAEDGSPLDVAGGRVTTLELADAGNITTLEIVNQPDFGRVTVNPDNTLSVVLTGTSDSGSLSFAYQVTLADGSVETRSADLTVAPLTQEQGWGLGLHYLLEEDANGNMVVEYGDNHRCVYISGSADALTKTDIAALEGLSESAITTAWLVAHPEYGGSEEMALSADVGMPIWYQITRLDQDPGSHWLLFEKGYTYSDLGRVIERGSTGEDELHPLLITSYGEGDKPIIDSKIWIFQETASNIVVTDVEVAEGLTALTGSNLLFDDVRFSSYGDFQHIDGLTIRNSEFVDAITPAPVDPSGEWSPHADRTTALYGADLENVLIEGSLFDHAGWADGYDGTADEGQPPSMFSHNLYFQENTWDVTFRDSITMRAASIGAQFRGGVHAEGNLYLDNNVGTNFLGGNYADAGPIGNYTYFADNVITSGAHKEAFMIGAYAMGVDNGAIDTTLLDNIIAHLADPNNAEEFAEKLWNNSSLINRHEAFYDDTIIYNWIGSRYDSYDKLWSNGGANGLTAEELNKITIQNFIADLLIDPDATIADLADYLRAQVSQDGLAVVKAAQDIITFFQQGFGIAPDGDGSDAVVAFVPNALADGVRWDNAINWTGEAVPTDGDKVLLGGNWVTYGSAGTNAISLLDLGPGGTLDIHSGKLTVSSGVILDGTGEINVTYSGQFWLDTYSDGDTLSLTVEGGRFANTGLVSGGLDMSVSGGQALLGIKNAVFDLSAGSELSIEGTGAKIGFDGLAGDLGLLRMEEDAVLSFVFDTTGVSAIGEFRSGYYGSQASDVASGANLGGGTLALDLSALTAGTGHYTLIELDELTGRFDELSVTGLGNRNATITVDYLNDVVTLDLYSGTGKVEQTVIGNDVQDVDGNTALWDALTGQFGIYLDDVA